LRQAPDINHDPITLTPYTRRRKSQPGKFGQGDKWIFCLSAPKMPRIRRDHDETFAADAFTGRNGLAVPHADTRHVRVVHRGQRQLQQQSEFFWKINA